MKCIRVSYGCSLLASLFLVFASPGAVLPGTAFTYQGRLEVETGLARGVYGFRFALFDAATAVKRAR